jgi:hypothetical protein
MAMLIFAIVLFLFLLVFFAMAKRGAKQNAQKEQELHKLLGDLGFEAKEEFSSDIQDVLELLESHHPSNSIEISSLYQHRTHSQWQLGFKVNYDADDEPILIIRGTKRYPISLIVSIPSMEGVAGKMIEFIIKKIQVPHLKKVEITDPKLLPYYKIFSDNPNDLSNQLTNATLEELKEHGHFAIHLEGYLMVISLFQLPSTHSTLEQDIQRFIDIAKAIQRA